MSVATLLPAPEINLPAAIPSDPIMRLSVEQYHAMIRTGILTADNRVELLEGWLIPQMPKNPQHRISTRLMQKALEAIIPTGWYVDAQEPITLADSEPEPDVMIVRGDTRDYVDRHPGPQDLALVVEVADSTLERDQGTKKRAYARAGVAVYWIVNLAEQRLEVYTGPAVVADKPDYLQQQDYGLSDEVTVEIEDEDCGAISVRELFS
jgi:Uma2 family endonuclease